MVIRSVLSENDLETLTAILVTKKNFPKLATTPVKSFERSFASASQGVEIYISPVFNHIQNRPVKIPTRRLIDLSCEKALRRRVLPTVELET